MAPKLTVGRRVREVRERSGRTQAAIAGLCAITVDYLSQIERGLKVPSVDVLWAISRELGVPVAHLLEQEDVRPSPAEPEIAPAVAAALLGYQTAVGGDASVDAVRLRERVESAWASWQSEPARFTAAAEVLPQLIVDVEQALRASRAPGEAAVHRDVLRCAADLYGLLRSYCRRAGRADLSLMVADRALRAAEDAEDPIRIATAHWNLGHILLGDDQPEAATEVARQGVARLSSAPTDRASVAMKGALELVTVVALGRQQRHHQAREHLLSFAEPLADQAGETNTGRTVFGPTNVGLHLLSIEMEAGETSEALRVADQLVMDHVPSLERRFTFDLDVARCHFQRREDAAVLLRLIDLEAEAPEDLARSPAAREMTRDLVRRVRPTLRRQAIGLADRIGVVC
ncbi:helix-turn-helix domain-containing protein [Streptomyces sp. XM4011]|uniref:helix-turn-helix domain-containing protein n=1 Tax=Streptomyces sp. XM4011 TaxID=2929780 RepID=UPI001FFBC145|nr:helix-turn-helix transcriptional regulator [Streptomyces sp. XM4011]MCK1812774.1 helix-turn-helix domain-containing protein [Streptomyces sp. XM4011]